MPEPLHVIVIGGGIGGLCLAQGLRQAGVSVAVYERDRTRGGRWEGYRLHINPAGSRSLHACLPDSLWKAFLATAGPGGDFGFLTEQLDELVVVLSTGAVSIVGRSSVVPDLPRHAVAAPAYLR